MAIKTEMLRYFVGVAEAGNLASAAKVLQRSPAAVSMMLKQFEEELGAPLFQTDRKNQLTELGAYTLAEAKRELAHFESAITSIMHFAESGEGQVRAAVIPAAAANLMPSVVERLRVENPNILVDIDDLTNEGVIAGVRGETVDIGIVNDLVLWGSSNIKHSLILTDRIGLLCARDSELGRKENLYWSDVAKTQMISHFLCNKINEPAVRKAVASTRLRVASALSIQSFVRGGAYVSPMPELGGISLPSDLVFRVPEGNEYWRSVYLIWNENRKPTQATIRLCKILRETIADMGMAPKLDAGDVFPSRD
ncbi:MAG: LysR family transcriptional regulator [Alphaproteobacteria bacterium]